LISYDKHKYGVWSVLLECEIRCGW